MKVVKFENQIINCEEIRNVSVNRYTNVVHIFFKNCEDINRIEIPYKYDSELFEILETIYHEMKS